MRRSRFAKAIEVTEVRERASVRDALRFDISNPETTDEEALCEWRLTGVQHAPLILGVTHLLITIAYVLLAKNISYTSLGGNPFLPAALVIALDMATAGLFLARRRFEIAPHTAFRLLCVYIGLAGILWSWFGYTISDDQFLTPLAATPIAMAAGIAMQTLRHNDARANYGQPVTLSRLEPPALRMVKPQRESAFFTDAAALRESLDKARTEEPTGGDAASDDD